MQIPIVIENINGTLENVAQVSINAAVNHFLIGEQSKRKKIWSKLFTVLVPIRWRMNRSVSNAIRKWSMHL